MKNQIAISNNLKNLYRENARLIKRFDPAQSRGVLDQLRQLTLTFGFSVAQNDLLRLDSGWYVTHSGLVRLASRKHCAGIRVEQVDKACDPESGRWVFKATVYKTHSSKGFSGYGDADPSNVSSLVWGAEMRVAETRAVNRALRKAYGIGLCSIEEMGSHSASVSRARESEPSLKQQPKNGSNDGQPRLLDKLCILIREYNLDPTLIKAYAADFCGTKTLRDANRDQVEAFISHLSQEAKKNRDSLVLNRHLLPKRLASLIRIPNLRR